MSSFPLELHDVLEEEYVSMYGPLPRPSRAYDEKDILDHDWARVILQECGRAANGKTVAQELSALVVGDESLQFLIGSPAITARGKVLLQDYDDYAALAAKQGGKTALEELRRGIVDEAFTGAVKPLRDVRLDKVYAALHGRAKEGKPRTALCISGGGIRSATFALGVIQGLASANILDRFDYLSTVSGGGYIGSWLSSWVRRHARGVTGVKEDLQRADTAIAESRPAVAVGGVPIAVKRDLPERKVNPEPAPLRHLREYSNYLSPRLGLFSGDTWTLASLYIRNLLLNLLVLIPLLALALAFPRIFSWLLELRENVVLPPVAWAWLAAVLTTLAFAYLGHKRPVEQGERAQTKAGTGTSTGSFILGCVLPLMGAAVALAVFWARAKQNEGLLTAPWTYGAAALAFLGMTLVPSVLYYRRYWGSLPAERRTSFAREGDFRKAHLKKQLRESVAILIAVVTTFALLWLLAVNVFDEPLRPVPTVETMAPIDRANVPASPQAQLYVSFAVPLVLLVFFLQASIFVGLSGPVNADSDREWWGRGGAWLLTFAAGLAILSAIAVFGPVAFYYAPVILASLGGAAGVAAALLGYSGKTAAKEKEDAGAAVKVRDLGSVLMVPLFIAALLAVISLGSTWLIQQLSDDPRIIQASRYAEQALLQARFKKPEETKAGMQTLATTPSPRVSIPALKATAHLQTVQHTSGTQVLMFLAVGALAVVLSLSIGVNKFSMHSLYRNRIIRAYLGASRYQRDPDRFTGFDENDNLQMWELRPELLWPAKLRDGKALIGALKNENNKLGCYLWRELEEETKDAVEKSIATVDALDAISTVALVQNLNAILLTGDLAASGVKLPEWITTRPDQIGYPLAMRNRAILDEQLAAWIVPMSPPADAKNAPTTDIRRGPLHVVNIALNLTSGENLAWQQRMAESFPVSPLHTGSLFLGFRPSREYGGSDGISLGTAVTISGAAASPNMGYHSSPTMAFLLTLFNIRLGSWLGNPGPHGQTSFDKSHPTTTLIPLFAELTGNSNSASKWVYLSDGGHFENLALYEMVVRRCHRIVLSDGGADPNCTFEDLGNAIRKIRTDLGIPIDIRKFTMAPRAKDGKPVTGEYVAFATIRYSAVDEDAEDGKLIYIKPGVYSGEYLPHDVYNYAMESLAFPHEPTSDQFFSESQFESYRALGRHAVNEICKNYPPPDLGGARIPIAKTYSSVDEFAERVAEGEKL